ncbi:hypothetical protein ACR74R_13320, partial [Mediterraneibacter gnavus]|uniref:hypothetical protein n=1 Tax=Mediterraneibacter gnavus TaxID=33038 RepID=UPI003DA275E7
CQKRTAGKTINTVFPAQNEYPQNKKINFVIFYNDLCIPLNSNEFYTPFEAERNIYGIFIRTVSFQRQAHQQHQRQRLLLSLWWKQLWQSR